MATTLKSSSRDAYDPSRKWGLLPAAGMAPGATRTSASLGGGTTYVMPGLVISAQRDKTVGEVMGRERHDKKRRQAEKAAQEKELEQLIERDGRQSSAARSVVMARRALLAKQDPERSKGKGKKKALTETDILGAVQDSSENKPSKRVFSATAIKQIGFDPSARLIPGERRRGDVRVVRPKVGIHRQRSF